MITNAVDEVSKLLGIELQLNPSQNSGDEYTIRPAEAPFPRGFALTVTRDYLVWHASIEPDPESRPLLVKMGNVVSDARLTELEEMLENTGLSNLKFDVNGKPFEASSIGENWLDFKVSGSVPVNKGEEDELSSLANLMLSVLSVPIWFLDKILSAQLEEESGLEEGASRTFLGHRYERSRVNRATCLRHYGFKCRGCGDIGEDKYGPLGREVIHVHHLLPVSKMHEEAPVNPLRDLIPLCPNCHNVVHREDPPVAIERLRMLTGYDDPFSW